MFVLSIEWCATVDNQQPTKWLPRWPLALFLIVNKNATSSQLGYQVTKRLSIDIENGVVDWQPTNSDIGCRFTSFSIDNDIKNPCQLKEELGWTRYQLTTRLMITKLSIDSLLNWQQQLHTLSIDNRNQDVRVGNGMVCNRCQSTTSKIHSSQLTTTMRHLLTLVLNWQNNCQLTMRMMLSIDKQPIQK